MPVAPYPDVRDARRGQSLKPQVGSHARGEAIMKLGIPMLAAALVVGSVALADEPRPNPDPANTNAATDQSPSYNQNASAGLTMTKGQVVSSDSRSNTLVVKVDKAPTSGEQSDMSFVVGPDTKILKGSKKASLSEVASGDKVTVNYKTVGGKNMAVSIGIEPAA
jgi:hypothetical protein